MSGASRGFPTAPEDVAAIAAALVGDPIPNPLIWLRKWNRA